LQVFTERGNAQTVPLGGIRRQDVEPARVADDGEAVASGQRLIGQQPRRVQHLAEVLRPHDAGLGEKSVHGGGGCCRGSGVRGAGALPGDRASALDGQHRLAP
jgi:hypothetical protein